MLGTYILTEKKCTIIRFEILLWQITLTPICLQGAPAVRKGSWGNGMPRVERAELSPVLWAGYHALYSKARGDPKWG